jgi:polyhydroxyalkanoate synthesis regulator phasin
MGSRGEENGKMRQDAWRAYLEMLVGVTEASRQRAATAAKNLVGKGAMTAEQLQSLADDLMKASTANRQALTKLVRSELDRALAAVGLVSADDVAALKGRIRDLETRLAVSPRTADGSGVGDRPVPDAIVDSRALATEAPTTTAGTGTVAKKAVAKKAAKKAVAKKAAAKRVTGAAAMAKPGAGKPAGTSAVAKKAAAKKAADSAPLTASSTEPGGTP